MPVSQRAQLQQQLSDILRENESRSAWTRSGFRADVELLGQLLRLTDPRNTTGAAVATAVDMWVAEQLRAAGIQHVLPRRSAPYYINTAASSLRDGGIPEAIEDFLSRVGETERSVRRELQLLASTLGSSAYPVARQHLRAALTHLKDLRSAQASLRPYFRKLIAELNRPTTTVIGEGRRKQIDVISCNWDRGLELAVSTKTLALGVEKSAELLKNQPNRWEEFDGDLKNLRGRFPLAAIGALILVPETLVQTDRLLPVVDMMRKLTAPGRDWVNAYDAAAVIVVSPWSFGQEGGVAIVSEEELGERLPSDIRINRFFSILVDKVLERAPITEHVQGRILRADALGRDGGVYIKAATAIMKVQERVNPQAQYTPETPTDIE